MKTSFEAAKKFPQQIAETDSDEWVGGGVLSFLREQMGGGRRA